MSKIKFTFNIQSFSDVITNSSSELFIVGKDEEITEDFLEKLENELIAYADLHDANRGSGDGRNIRVYIDYDFSEEDKKTYHKNCFHIIIDHALLETINYIKSELNPVDMYAC